MLNSLFEPFVELQDVPRLAVEIIKKQFEKLVRTATRLAFDRRGGAGTRRRKERFQNEKIGFFRLNLKNLPPLPRPYLLHSIAFHITQNRHTLNSVLMKAVAFTKKHE